MLIALKLLVVFTLLFVLICLFDFGICFFLTKTFIILNAMTLIN